jgi:hypothetical protein
VSTRPSDSSSRTGISNVDMRTATRQQMLQRCFVHSAKAGGPQAWRCIAYNISATGIGLALPVQLNEGTVLTIRAWELPRAGDLQACVVRATLIESYWFTGCEFVRRLKDSEVRVWSSGALDWVEAGT